MIYNKIQKSQNGPGGLKCACCTMGTPKEHKRLTKRRTRRILQKQLKQMERENEA